MSLTKVNIPLALRKVRAYQHYVNGKTVEEIAILECVPLSTVLEWKSGTEGDNSWDDDLARMETDLRDTLDGEMKSWAKVAVETVGMTCINTLVLCAKHVQKRVAEKGGSMDTEELIELTKVSCSMMKTLHEITGREDGRKDNGKQGRTKDKNLGTGNNPPSLPTVPPARPEGGKDEQDGDDGEGDGRPGSTYDVEDEGEGGNEA